MNTKGMLVSVYKSGDYDCTMNGVSSNVTGVILIGDNVPQISTPSDEYPALYLSDSPMLEPIAVPLSVHDGVEWGMFGGNFLWTSDSRFRNQVSESPIRIHDRIEK